MVASEPAEPIAPFPSHHSPLAASEPVEPADPVTLLPSHHSPLAASEPVEFVDPITLFPSRYSTWAASKPVEPAATLPPVPSSHRPSILVHGLGKQMRRRRKVKKSVTFDMMKNTLHRYTPVKAKFVTFNHKSHWVLYCHEVDPAGYDTLHCRKTKYIRDVPDLDLVDDDGDFDME
ncbi:MAG: hypothetical protein Q9223_003200 [Gallowayella weberi]